MDASRTLHCGLNPFLCSPMRSGERNRNVTYTSKRFRSPAAGTITSPTHV